MIAHACLVLVTLIGALILAAGVVVVGFALMLAPWWAWAIILLLLMGRRR